MAVARLVVVALEIIHDRVFLGREAPDAARIGGGADLIDLPVVGRAEVQRGGGKAVIGHGLGRRGAVGHGRLVGAEVHLLRGDIAAGPPIQGGIQADAGGVRRPAAGRGPAPGRRRSGLRSGRTA